MIKRLLLPVLGALLLISACSSSPGPTFSPIPPVAPSPSPSSGIEHPTGANDLVLRLEYVGGFIGPEAQLTRTPTLSVYGNGDVIAPGAAIATLNPPILPSLQESVLSPAGLDQLLVLAQGAGLLGPDVNYVGAPAPDMPSTKITINAAGRTHFITVTGQLEGPTGPSTVPDAAARAKLAAFIAQLHDFETTFAGELHSTLAYEPTALDVFVEPEGPLQEPAPIPLVWPLARPLAGFGAPVDPYLSGSLGATTLRCGVVSGSELGVLLPVLRQANVSSIFSSGNALFNLTFRPLLPNEIGCPSLTP